MSGGSEKALRLLDKRERVAFGVLEREARSTGFVLGDGRCFDFVSEKVFTHLGEIWSGESDFGEEIVGRAASDLLELDALAAVDGVTRIFHAKASGSRRIEAENFGVESTGGVKISGVETDGGDAGDFGARGRLC